MKVVFIYPGYENLGIEYLSAGLKAKGFETGLVFDPILFSESGFINNKVLSGLFSFHENIVNSVIDLKPGLICFSVITDNYLWACRIAKEIKRRTNAPIVFGGIHPTSVPDLVISEPFVDYVCVGEGDHVIIDLAEAIRGNKPANTIPNLWGKTNGPVFKNRLRPLIPNLDNLPFPDKDIYYRQFPIFNDGYLLSTSRGCPFKCSYCCNNIYHSIYGNNGGFIRRRSIDNVLSELKLAKAKYKPRFVHFVDEVFNYDPLWLFDFLSRYKKEISLPFSCYAYPDFVNRRMAKALKDAGCFKVQMGVQVIDENKRKAILKRDSLQENIGEAIDSLRENKIYITCDSILGFPDEREDDLLELASFYNLHRPDHCENFWLRYYPKAGITQWALENNYINQEKKQNIENGIYDFGLFKCSEHITTKTYAKKFVLFLNLYPFLSGKLRAFMLQKRLYRFLPPFPPILLLILIRLINRSKYDFNTLRTFKRYAYFSFKKAFIFSWARVS